MLWPKADIHVFAAAVKLPMGEEFSPFYPVEAFSLNSLVLPFLTRHDSHCNV